jgi:hypothetical protein
MILSIDLSGYPGEWATEGQEEGGKEGIGVNKGAIHIPWAALFFSSLQLNFPSGHSMNL